MRPPSDRARDWLDVLLAALLAALAQVELVASPSPTAWWEHAVAVLATVPLALRRRHPVAVLMAVITALSALTLHASSTFTVAQLLGMMLASYSVAALVATPPAAAGLAGILLAALVNSAVSAAAEPGDYVFAVILLGVPWLAGVGMRMWRARAEELGHLAAQLEESRELHAQLVVAAERGRIARDLHDTLAQTLNAVVVHAEAAAEALGRDEELVHHSLSRIREVSRGSLVETRALLGALRGEVDDAGGLRLADLDRLVDQCRSQGVLVEVRHRGEPAEVGAAVEAAAYRIVQESLTNARQHAPGSPVYVTIEHGDELRLEIRSQGRPASSRTSGNGYGLIGMRERAQLLGGELSAGPDGQGFVVRARLPVAGQP